jgi:hypothetical protein
MGRKMRKSGTVGQKFNLSRNPDRVNIDPGHAKCLDIAIGQLEAAFSARHSSGDF